MQEKIDFWTQMTETLQRRVKREHTILLGDFNFVESALDRLPQHVDDNRLIQTFEHVTRSLQMVDGWRLDNPNQIDFTFSQTHATGNSLARIDRIYINSELFTFSHNWNIEENAAISDHRIPTVEIIKKHQPFIGPGYWKIPLDIIDHHTFVKNIEPLLEKTNKDIIESKAQRTESKNPQTIWQNCKEKILHIAKDACRTRQKEMTAKRNALKKKMKNLHQKLPTSPPDEKTRTKNKIKQIQSELQFEDAKKMSQMQMKAKTNYYAKGERNTKYWFNLN